MTPPDRKATDPGPPHDHVDLPAIGRAVDLFPTDRPLRAAELIGRDTDMSDLADQLRDGEHRIVVGHDKCGKTSVAAAAASILAGEGWLVVTVDLFRTCGADELTAALLDAAGVDVAQRPADPPLGYAIATLDEHAASLGRRAVLYVDGFHEVATTQVFGKLSAVGKELRVALDAVEHVVCLLVGGSSTVMRGLFTSKDQPFHHFGRLTSLPAIDADAWRAALPARFMAGGQELTNGGRDRLLELGQGHPRATMLIAQHGYALAAATGRARVDEQFVDRALQSALSAERVLAETRLGHVRALSKYALATAIRVARDDSPYKNLPPAIARQTLRGLETAGVVDHPHSGTYAIADPMLRHHLLAFADCDGMSVPTPLAAAVWAGAPLLQARAASAGPASPAAEGAPVVLPPAAAESSGKESAAAGIDDDRPDAFDDDGALDDTVVVWAARAGAVPESSVVNGSPPIAAAHHGSARPVTSLPTNFYDHELEGAPMAKPQSRNGSVPRRVVAGPPRPVSSPPSAKPPAKVAPRFKTTKQPLPVGERIGQAFGRWWDSTRSALGRPYRLADDAETAPRAVPDVPAEPVTPTPVAATQPGGHVPITGETVGVHGEYVVRTVDSADSVGDVGGAASDADPGRRSRMRRFITRSVARDPHGYLEVEVDERVVGGVVLHRPAKLIGRDATGLDPVVQAAVLGATTVLLVAGLVMLGVHRAWEWGAFAGLIFAGFVAALVQATVLAPTVLARARVTSEARRKDGRVLEAIWSEPDMMPTVLRALAHKMPGTLLSGYAESNERLDAFRDVGFCVRKNRVVAGVLDPDAECPVRAFDDAVTAPSSADADDDHAEREVSPVPGPATPAKVASGPLPLNGHPRGHRKSSKHRPRAGGRRR